MIKKLGLLFLSFSFCVHAQESTNSFDDILLVINYNWPLYKSVEFLKELYGQYFPHIVFYGPREQEESALAAQLISNNTLHYSEHREGWFSYITLADAMQRYPNYKGYLWVHDDVLMTPKNFYSFNKEKIWSVSPYGTMSIEEVSKDSSWCWSTSVGYRAFQSWYDQLDIVYKNRMHTYIGTGIVTFGWGDIVYVPQRLSYDFIQLSHLAEANKVFLEIAIPCILACLDAPSNRIPFKVMALWSAEERHNVTQYYTPELDVLHPLKFATSSAHREFAQQQLGIVTSGDNIRVAKGFRR